MKVVKIDEIPKEPVVHPLFTGRDVTRQVLLPDSKDYSVNIVNFGKNVRNKFHSHDCEQVLIVTGGIGIVATKDEERLVKTGDVILFPAEEKHWHGATKESEFSHLYITRAGSKLKQFED